MNYKRATCVPSSSPCVLQAGKGPRDDDSTVTDSDTVVTFTPSGGDNPVVLSYTFIGYLSADNSRFVGDMRHMCTCTVVGRREEDTVPIPCSLPYMGRRPSAQLLTTASIACIVACHGLCRICDAHYRAHVKCFCTIGSKTSVTCNRLPSSHWADGGWNQEITRAAWKRSSPRAIKPLA